jgi:diguanylate cyclase (GGDEF)-like protein
VFKPVLTHLALFVGGGALLGWGARRTQRRYIRLSSAAATDALTRLPNRGALLRHLGLEFARARRHGHSLSLLMIDIDDFKRFNDHYGHRAGDDCLKRIAATLGDGLRRPGDYVGRFGGEEFLAVLSHADADEAARTGERLRAAVESMQLPAAPGAPRDAVTVSVGVATQRATDAIPENLFDRADAAMYRAKRAGKNRVVGRSGLRRPS